MGLIQCFYTADLKEVGYLGEGFSVRKKLYRPWSTDNIKISSNTENMEPPGGPHIMDDRYQGFTLGLRKSPRPRRDRDIKYISRPRPRPWR